MLLVIALIIGALIVVGVATVATVAPAARKHMRISPSIRSRAPVAWRWAPTRAATLHRRLREAAGAARHTGQRDDLRGWLSPDYALSVRAVEVEALRVEANLVHAAKGFGPVRRRRLASIERRVGELEGTVNQLLASTADWSEFVGVQETDREAVVIDLTETITKGSSPAASAAG